MFVCIPAVELKDELFPINEALVLSASMTTLAAKEPLVPAATRFDVPNSDQWLWLHPLFSHSSFLMCGWSPNGSRMAPRKPGDQDT